MNTMHRGILLAGLAALGAGALLAASAWRALSLAPVTAEAPPAPATADPTRAGQERLEVAALDLVAENDPFRPERAPAPLPYRMPGDPRPEEPAPPPEPPPEPPPFQVLGTVAMGNGGGIALIRTEEGAAPRFMRVGENVQGFRLTAVHQSAAVLERGDQMVQLAVADPDMVPAPPERDRNERRRRGRDEQETAERITVEFIEARENLLQQQRQLMQDRRGGGAAAAIDSARTMLRARVGGAVIVRPPVTRPDTTATGATR